MSYILEALKRSEQERNQSELPSFRQDNALLYLKKEGKSWWPFALIIVLSLNALVFLYIHFTETVNDGPSIHSEHPVKNSALVASSTEVLLPAPKSFPAPKAEQNIAIPAELSIPPSPKQLSHPNSGLVEYKKQLVSDVSAPSDDLKPAVVSNDETSSFSEQSSAELSIPVANDLAAELESAESQDQSVSEATREQMTAQVSYSEEVVQEQLPSLYKDTPFLVNMPEQSRPNVPKLIFNSHIYSDNPSARRVMINNIYLREGQVFSGLEVIEIGELDVVFEKAGTQFKLQAMRDWHG